LPCSFPIRVRIEIFWNIDGDAVFSRLEGVVTVPNETPDGIEVFSNAARPQESPFETK
jgi:hypothetical protein